MILVAATVWLMSCSCSHHNHYITLGISRIVTARLLTDRSHTLHNIHSDARENVTNTRAKTGGGLLFRGPFCITVYLMQPDDGYIQRKHVTALHTNKVVFGM